MQPGKLVLGILSLPLLLLPGCSGSIDSAVLGTAPAAPAVSSPAIAGSVYGGHAPIVNAKVYVLTPSTIANGGLATSLMESTSSTTGGYPVTRDTSGGASNGLYYVQSDSTGIFNFTDDYTCTVNQPVYIVAVGGSPVYPSTASVVVSNVAVGATTGTGTAQTATLPSPRQA